MIPTLYADDVLWLDRWTVTTHAKINRGDIIALKVPEVPGGASGITTKRVLGVAGDEVHFVKGVFYLNGQPQMEPWVGKFWKGTKCFDTSSLFANTVGQSPSEGSLIRLVVPEGHVFVVGDNRVAFGSEDSRVFNSVPLENVRGRVTRVLWPLNRKKAVNYNCGSGLDNAVEFSDETVPNARAL